MSGTGGNSMDIVSNNEGKMANEAMDIDVTPNMQPQNDPHPSSPFPQGKTHKTYCGPFAKFSVAHHASATAAGSSQSGSRSSFRDLPLPANFDLDEYLSHYSGVTVIDRLLYIADHCPALSVQAYQQTMAKLKKTSNTSLYRTVAQKNAGIPGFEVDEAWIEATDNATKLRLERLDADLTSFKANLIKDNVRLTSKELGNAHFDKGDYGAAIRSYSRMRDYCSNPSHHSEMNICQAKACLQLNSYAQLMTHIARCEAQVDLDKSQASILKVWAALAHIYDRKYRVAARKLLELRIGDLPNNLNETITIENIAVFATLMALAEFDRRDISNRIINNSEFKPFLESSPLMLELTTSFYDSKYARCMAILNQIAPALRLDFRIGDHVDTLLKNIHAKALIQYFTPFSTVDMNQMATAFDTTVAKLETDIAELIVSGQISARIDSHNKRIYATTNDQRTATFSKAYHAGDAFKSETMAMLLRINLIRCNFVVKGGKGPGTLAAEAMDIQMAMMKSRGR